MKPVFGRTSRSTVWDHFEQSKDGKSAKFKLCECVCAYHGKATSNLHSHLKNHHPSVVGSSSALTAEEAGTTSAVKSNKLMTDFAVSQPKSKTCGPAQAECVTQLLLVVTVYCITWVQFTTLSAVTGLLQYCIATHNFCDRTSCI